MNKSNAILAFALAALCLTGALIGGFVVSQQDEQPKAGAADTNVLPSAPTTSTTAYAGKDVSTEVVAANPSRRYLEIANLSGATTTPQALYCNIGATATPYSGMVIHASSSKVFDLDNLPRSAVNCRYTHSTTSVGVIDF